MNTKDVEKYFNAKRHCMTDNECAVISAVLRKIEQDADPSQAEEHKERGNEEYRAGNFKAALAAYTQAVDCNPSSAVYLSNRAAAYAKLGMVEEAIQDCEQGLSIDDKFVKLYVRLGMLYADRDEDRAYEVFGKGLLVDPENETLKKQRELLINREAREAPAGIPEANNSGFDLSSLLADKSMTDLINNIVKDRSPQELADMVKSMMGSMDLKNAR